MGAVPEAAMTSRSEAAMRDLDLRLTACLAVVGIIALWLCGVHAPPNRCASLPETCRPAGWEVRR